MSMSRKHYQAIAEIVGETTADDPRIRGELAWRLAAMFLKDNPNFDPARFGTAIAKAVDSRTQL